MTLPPHACPAAGSGLRLYRVRAGDELAVACDRCRQPVAFTSERNRGPVVNPDRTDPVRELLDHLDDARRQAVALVRAYRHERWEDYRVLSRCEDLGAVANELTGLLVAVLEVRTTRSASTMCWTCSRTCLGPADDL